MLDHEAFGRLNVLEVDSTKRRFHQCHRVDERLGIFGRQLDIDRIDIGETFEQHRLAFHHWFRRQCSQITKAENGRAVRDDRNKIALGGVIIGSGRIFGDGADGDGNAGRIGQRQVPLRRHRLRGDNLDLPRAPR